MTEVVRRLALAVPDVAFVLTGSDRTPSEWPAREGDEGRARRIADVLGREFVENAIPIAAEREGVHLTGFAGLPAYTRAAATHQYLFVNGRPVRDRVLMGALRAAYSDVMARDRHPAAVLFITLDPREVDVNVHPAKADVRFRDPGLVRGLLIGAIREAIARANDRATTSGAAATLAAFRAQGFGGQGFGGQGFGGSSGQGGGAGFGRFGGPRPAPSDWRASAFRPLDGEAAGSEAVSGLAEEGVAYAADGLQAAFGELTRPSADARAGQPAARMRRARAFRSARRGRRFMGPISSPRRATASSWSISMPPTSASSTSASRPSAPSVVSPGKSSWCRRSSICRPRTSTGWSPAPKTSKASASSSRRSAPARSPCARRRPCSARPMPRRSSVISSTRSPNGTAPPASRTPQPHRLDHGLPRLGAGRPPDAPRGDGRPPARDGGDAEFRHLQSRAADLHRLEPRRHRAPVRPSLRRTPPSRKCAISCTLTARRLG